MITCWLHADVSPSLLMIVDAVVERHGRPVLCPGVADPYANRLIGKAVRIVRPDGTAFLSTVQSIEIPTPNPHRRYPIQLSTATREQPVPTGSEVWYSGRSY